MKRSNLLKLVLALLAVLQIWSCNRNRHFTDNLENLVFETDSVIFDTVFTNKGSATQVFKVYNKGKDALQIERLFLAGGNGSFYRLNFDGNAGTVFQNLEILPGDSMYFFTEVLIDPNSVSMPFVVKDSIIFKNGDVQKDMKLLAWGQNAYVHNNEWIEESTTWKADMPHLLFGEVVVDSGATLTIPECTKIYGHNMSRLNVNTGGTLKVFGTDDCPVIFQGDRLEAAYDEEPGQWIGIRLLPGAISNEITHAIIKNGFRGIEIQNMNANGEPNLFIQNSTITTMNLVCILGYTASFVAVNCEFTNSCQYLAVGELGGNYNFTYCTFGNFQKNCARSTPSVYLSNANYVDKDKNEIPNNLTFNIMNCIVYGSQDEEISFNQSGSGNIDAFIGYTLLKTKFNNFKINNNLINANPRFVNPAQFNYSLDTLSPVQGKAMPLDNITTDYHGNTRDATNPDMGAFERQE
ncbi:hypothetical protein GC194_05525 [bacterium]|nr:hypothetical protein [bacterium]